MGSLGPKKISSNYHKLLQISESGFVADGTGSLITLNISGSQYYTSGSGQSLMALGVTGSIIPEGGDKWDLGSEDNPFKHLFVSDESIHFVNKAAEKGSADRKIKLTFDDISDWQKGIFTVKRSSTTGRRLTSPLASTIRTAGVEPFVWDENDDLVSNDLTSLHIVSDKFWTWNSSLNELETRSIMFKYHSSEAPSNDLVIGG